MSRRLDIKKLHNIRDLGGEKTKEGKRIIPGKLIRSGKLENVPEDELDKLESMLGTVVDFRSDGEHNREPDVSIPGVDYHHLPIVETQAPGITREGEADVDLFGKLIHQPDKARDYMCDLYRNFILSDYSISQYARFVRILLEEHDKAVLWHCTAGKDRAGMASVIVEEILGLPREEIIREYLLSDEYLAEDIHFLTNFIKKRANTDSEEADLALAYLFGAKREYIDTFYEAVDDRFGSFDAFIKEGLGLSEEEILKMRELYLEDF